MIHIHCLSHSIFLEQDTFVSLYIGSSPVSVDLFSCIKVMWNVFVALQSYYYNLLIYHKLSKTYW